MDQTENKNFAVDLKLKGIELLHGSINFPANPNISLSTFNFNISLETRADATTKMLFIIVAVEIKSEDQNNILGSLTASCIYEISDFDKYVKFDSEGKLHIPPQVNEILGSITISTVRGIMFSTYKGTFLHNAFLPIIDPRSLKPLEVRPQAEIKKD
jgi:hypothetical protein